MSSNLDTVITRDQAIERFENEVLPYIQRQYEDDGIPDYCARATAWNDWTDGLCKNEEISDWQYDNWSHPECCLTERERRLAC